MDLVITLGKENKVILELRNKKGLIDRLQIEPHLHLDSILISSVDKFFKRNKIKAEFIDNVKVKGIASPTSSSHRIIQTFAQALKSQ
ncbi:MAG: hypothetical protein UW43_C0006G0015 [Candidatus Yanofskybacteria bacterium GW2011_GWA1_44_21]|uniref:Uncharacterized protein n=2 Tax=Candidatus Yanofskyibacteriota TaxID=1752733 RepID=A0A1F8H339_9BACT|nr:MAG: hypothetical protein UW14_C0008G0046 [Candidatus Yanofskybacteria bacterium GW2011_GWA2_44_10]KKT50458.1 MAG: hypothetical protein UW43_C0006G0015 [Candidatus Yanofskybacteria bacterium GW2011_GWA1_44_21]KKT90245.1 MAG: hypothetical protein UW90_C0004G0053 [Candidatus Yanofskybacteria bacterium GW2011_GWB1_45_11]OGN03246.1 MAG: hypothetical protein A2657_01205 [Candidatus Yanofskybacteria bacterium RIFCSPHIGHO2_01_FULL_44_110b]OGN18491.1 MAG: hypothetical protein A3F50_01970 [Candidatus